MAPSTIQGALTYGITHVTTNLCGFIYIEFFLPTYLMHRLTMTLYRLTTRLHRLTMVLYRLTMRLYRFTMVLHRLTMLMHRLTMPMLIFSSFCRVSIAYPLKLVFLPCVVRLTYVF